MENGGKHVFGGRCVHVPEFLFMVKFLRVRESVCNTWIEVRRLTRVEVKLGPEGLVVDELLCDDENAATRPAILLLLPVVTSESED
jgi:hypothetical protein